MRISWHIDNNSRLQQCTLAFPAKQDFCALYNRLRNNFLQINSRLFVDHCSHPGFRIRRIPGYIFFCFFYKAFYKCRSNTLLHQNSFHRRTALPRIAKSSLCSQVHCKIQIRIFQNDQRVVTAEFQNNFFITCSSCYFFPYSDTPGKGYQIHLRRLDQDFCHLLCLPKQYTQHVFRQTCFI
ncbi:hypothetical protein D3C86_1465210 [compost metagenome]